MPSIVHREIISLAGSPDQVAEFITSPECILDYYPSPYDCGVFQPGESFYCRGQSGVSLIERCSPASDTDRIVLKVTSAAKVGRPLTAEAIRQSALFTMYEDWELEPGNPGTVLTKTWRDIEKIRLKLLPMALIVRRSAKSETNKLQQAWDKRALA